MLNFTTEILLQKIFLHTIDHLSEEDKKFYLELIEKEAQPQKIEKFLNEKILGYTDITIKIVDNFISRMKTAAT